MQAKVKICGIKALNDALWASNLGADFLGLNFYDGSPRFLSVTQAAKIKKSVPEYTKLVGVFVDALPEYISAVMAKVPLWGLQFHGAEQPEYLEDVRKMFPEKKIIKAFRVKSERSAQNMKRFTGSADYFLFDAYSGLAEGGTGETFDWNLVEEFKTLNKEFFIAGGLTPDNVRDAIEKTKPFAVDVASGVETGKFKKDYELLRRFIYEAKRTVF